MVSPDPEFEDLLGRLRAGCPEAAHELLERYGGYLRAVIRRRLHRKLRSVYDSQDFVQSVWASFLHVPPDRYTFADADELVAFLARVAHNKLAEVFRQRFQTAKRNIGREVALPGPADEEGRDPGPPNRRDPTPSQVAIAGEHWERLTRDQPPEVRQVLEMLRQGYGHREIAQRLRLHPKMIQRLVTKLSERISLP
jgi:RNA polymerase sigma factor (sigma-70 family)